MQLTKGTMTTMYGANKRKGRSLIPLFYFKENSRGESSRPTPNVKCKIKTMKILRCYINKKLKPYI